MTLRPQSVLVSRGDLIRWLGAEYGERPSTVKKCIANGTFKPARFKPGPKSTRFVVAEIAQIMEGGQR